MWGDLDRATGGSAIGQAFRPGGPLVPPTGRAFTLPYVKFLVFDDRGLITHDRQYQDNLALLDQLALQRST